MTQCMGTRPPTYGTRNGWPTETRVRCHRRIGVAIWQGSHGQTMVACPAHRKQVEALDAPYRAVEITNADATHSVTGPDGTVVGPGETKVLRWNAPRQDPEMRERVTHEQEEGYRDAMQDAGRGSLLR